MKRIILVLIFSCICGSAMAAVSLTDSGGYVEVDNGVLFCKFEKATAKMIELRKNGGPDLINQAAGGSWYWDSNADCDPVDSYLPVTGASYSIIQQSDELVEISFKELAGTGPRFFMAYDYDVHYVIKDGESGVYAFAIFTVNNQPAFELEQARCVIRINPDIFDFMVADDERQYYSPTPAELACAIANGGTMSPKEATDMSFCDSYTGDVVIDDKYLMSNFIGLHEVHGWCGLVGGENWGMWMVEANHEYQNGGPWSQELTVHQTTTTPVILNTFQGGHYGSGSNVFAENESWQKIYGPFMLYVNQADSHELMYQDAKNKLYEEREKWPYSWAQSEVYPLDRCEVKGKIDITSGCNPEGVWVILADSFADSGDWQTQGKGYITNAWTQADGSFTIPDVRKGNYSLYAFTDGIAGQFVYDGVVVDCAQDGSNTVNLGTLKWTPYNGGKDFWQVGVFDRTAGEYKYGDLFHDGSSWGMYLNYPIDFPNDIVFTPGVSNERTDWNYTQMSYRKEDGSWHLPQWSIEFQVDRYYTGTATLTIGIAGQRNGALLVTLVQRSAYTLEYDTVLDAGAATVRNSIAGSYELKRITFDASKLKKGTNRIVLKNNRGTTFSDINYDAIKLEVPFISDFNGDGVVDYEDLIYVAICWLDDCVDADFNGSGVVDYEDFLVFAEEMSDRE